MRTMGGKYSLSYDKTLQFFESRANNYNGCNPYSVTMYQDGKKDLVLERNRVEIESLLPKLQLSSASCVLDVACGIGRWADAINVEVSEYLGFDFSPNLIALAKSRNMRNNFSYIVASVPEIKNVGSLDRFNRVIISGVLIYLNDEEVSNLFDALNEGCGEGSIICLREPIGVEARLNILEHYSEDLKTEYNAIYRTNEELLYYLGHHLSNFKIVESGQLFQDSALNNRKETTQHFYILAR